jgi:hypothetical protein
LEIIGAIPPIPPPRREAPGKVKAKNGPSHFPTARLDRDRGIQDQEGSLFN